MLPVVHTASKGEKLIVPRVRRDNQFFSGDPRSIDHECDALAFISKPPIDENLLLGADRYRWRR